MKPNDLGWEDVFSRVMSLVISQATLQARRQTNCHKIKHIEYRGDFEIMGVLQTELGAFKEPMELLCVSMRCLLSLDSRKTSQSRVV